jgi:preprotein translocase SecE subunit
MGIAAGAPESELETPDAPKPSRSSRRAEAKAAKEAEKRKRAEQKRREREQLAKKQKQAAAQRQRGGVIGFLLSCWAELKKVQWPDRETLIQATAVTVLFVAVAAAYLGALDAFFNWLIKHIIL